jgi:stalled ribosome rescue protein Dom34
MSSVAVWVDQHEAKIFEFNATEGVTEKGVASPRYHFNNRIKSEEGPKVRDQDAQHYFHEIATALKGASQVLIVGPSIAKLQLLRWLHTHDHLLEQRVVGVETVDHPTDRQLLAFAQKAFQRVDAAR